MSNNIISKQDKAENPAVTLIAHRGYSERFPENTLLAYQAAYAFGGRWMECDIQLTNDHVPVLHHDETLQRMAGVDLNVNQISAKKFKALTAYYPEKFGQQFYGNSFTTLKALAKWVKSDRDIKMFIEVKQHSIDEFGIKKCMKQIFKRILSITGQCVIISFNDELVAHAREQYDLEIGWVIPEWSAAVEQRAMELQADFLFTNKQLLPENTADWWQGEWQWAIYNVDVASELSDWTEKGLQFIETNDIGELLHAATQENK